ncbi:uncharacterized protein TRAVEDRAFT_53936 [Trametes versicolor FP-101664 SS1]|uniref:Uncharacterized protein n=1 Tax=Trametes versicolor (strain FP-101664) TaxID=717944 RepID=R7S8F4_TRAVS|nr:uncharacterized protein TRAVEDRAFT_53936 [Trametes versicolor FP-101664 SS1]EIW51942.1 hypothetical protein TRAVEDRAFT_53936 [Trametes versicolor FP-101664 SS1]
MSLPTVRYGRAAGRIRSDLPGEEPARSVRREAERVGIAYPTPAGLTVAQFELLLSPFRAPEAAATLMASLSTNATISLLRAAHELGRGAVVHVAKARLCSLWDDRRLPMAESYQTANLGGIGRHTPSPDDGPRPYTEALAALRAAEEFGLQSVAKRAAYELTCSEDFWTALVTDRASVDISQDVLVGVYNMRTMLKALWADALRSPPRMPGLYQYAHTSCHPLLRQTLGQGCARREGAKRMEAWRAMLEDTRQRAEGAWDPLRYNIFARMDELHLKQWCSCCIREWETDLKRRREEWWTRWMGQVFV